MSEKEIKLFVVFLQKIDEQIWTERMDRLLWYTIGTFHKQYDREEERDCIIETITDYLGWKAEYIDKQFEEDKKDEEAYAEKKKKEREMIECLWKVIKYFN